MPGIATSAAEVTHISRNGLWLLIDDEELLLSFVQIPVVPQGLRRTGVARRATRPRSHLYWPDLDIDLSVESIRRPEAFPLVSRADG